ncbi:UDP-glucose/GDP-mannose dehydrogenase family protein [Nocardia uniformis]|uniref:UDP-glucose 6-dehydrogenase n=1 Tax=Nocardia uniformis TaxID=53432 RepID=A0A849CDU1_9NOCA|nr:UDP-glucose/GDP-mannose dehydrogenase family protein [Nocardia uniformis]NNH76038.1 UDP-glucose/GDP-mannose dehydrogenase family protein [Nocardia uniformis]
MRCTVFGTGYLGTTHAICMAELGHHVLGVDTDPGKITKLSSGQLPFYEPDLEPLLRRNLAVGRLHFTTSYPDAAQFADLHILTVGTPSAADGHTADLTDLYAVANQLAALIERPAVILGKSTVPAGTAARLAAHLREQSPTCDFELAWNPEFLREGHALQDALRPDRIVLGVDMERTLGRSRAEQQARHLYADQLKAGVPLVVTNLETAELAKMAANAYLATKISFINAISDLCEGVGADVRALADILGHDPRIGRFGLDAGIGFGGGCLPKDLRALAKQAGELGAVDAAMLLREVEQINLHRRVRVVDLARQACGGSLRAAHVAVLGAAFKAESDDVRDSPALHVSAAIQQHGAFVTVYDPKALDNARQSYPTLTFATTITHACENADVVLVLTEWEQFAALNPDELTRLVRNRSIIDGRSSLDSTRWREAGWAYRAPGIPKTCDQLSP